MLISFTAPEPLTPAHELSDFQCGEASLDDWLRRRALANQMSGASRTFVVCDEQRRVMGFYALAAGAVSQTAATGHVRRGMPDPIPVLVLGRLAVHSSAQGMQLGASLLHDAVRRAATVAEQAGVRALLVHALNDNAKAFYLRYGFQVSPTHDMTLMLRLDLTNY